MSGEKLHEALTEVSEEFVKESAPNGIKRNRKVFRIAAAAAVFAAVVLAAVIGATALFRREKPQVSASSGDQQTQDQQTPEASLSPEDGEKLLGDHVVSTAVYPSIPRVGSSEYYDYLHLCREFSKQGIGLQGFYAKTAREFLSGEGNMLYSPFNVYMALSMLAECSGGEARAELLALLGSPDIESLRAKANALLTAAYFEDDLSTILPGASIWMSDSIEYDADALNILAEYYSASSFAGEFGTPEYDGALHEWMNKMTNGLLKDQINDLETDPWGLLYLVTTLYYKTGWGGEFVAEATRDDVFHSPAGDATVPFMHGFGSLYYKGEGYTAVGKYCNEGTIWFVLPDEGMEMDGIIAPAFDAILNGDAAKESGRHEYSINLSVPKFDIETNADLKAGLMKLGVKRCFDPELADLSGIGLDPVAVTQIIHGVRFKMDEEGVEAAAYTYIPAPGDAMPPDDIIEIDFCADRPFLFIAVKDHTPLFAGKVENPNG